MKENKCDTCGGIMEFDEDDYIYKCPHCGNEKRPFSGNVFVKEKERTKRHYATLSYNERFLKIKTEHDRKKNLQGILVPLILIFVSILIPFTMMGYISCQEKKEIQEHIKNNEVLIERSADDFYNENCFDVQDYFKSLGFTNIIMHPQGDMVLSILFTEYAITEVSIDGNSDFSSDTWFKKDAVVRIKYHSKKK